jgi:hypothetical protein
LRGGLRLVFGNGLGIAADGSVLGRTIGRGGQPLAGGLIVLLDPVADDVADAFVRLFRRELVTEPLDPLTGLTTFGGANQATGKTTELFRR